MDGDVHDDDVTWARALATGARDAIERYERELVPLITAQLRKRGYTAEEAAEIHQVLRARLLVGDGDGPAIAGYTGRGKLRSWVLVAALREAVRQRELAAREPATDDDALLALAHRADTPGTAPEKQRYRDEFRAAFRTALATLEPRDRNLLRLHVLDELSIDEIGRLHGVHRATAARWLEQARETVARLVREDLVRTLGIDPHEVGELMAWVKSRIDLSLSGLAAS